jgi:predicted kinase
MYDLAFLLMDLHHRGLTRQANAALNTYMERRPDFAGLRLLPLFLSCRAAIRTKVSLAEASVQADPRETRRFRDEACEYLPLAAAFLQSEAPTLVAIGGLSGSGKSTLAALLAPALGGAPGAVIVRSDAIRKEMFAVDPLCRLPDSAYAPDVTARVYRRALHAAEACLAAGHSAIVDAVFADPRHRQAIEAVAAAAGAPFIGLWMEVPFDVAAERLRTRVNDVSDATPHVLRLQTLRRPGRIDWTRIDGRAIAPDTIVTLDAIGAAASAARGDAVSRRASLSAPHLAQTSGGLP